MNYYSKFIDREWEPAEDDLSQASGSSTGVVPPSNTSRGSKSSNLFSHNDAEEFRKVFKDLITSKKQIMGNMIVKRLEENSKLCSLLAKFTKQQLADKVRTERKILARGKTQRKCKRK